MFARLLAAAAIVAALTAPALADPLTDARAICKLHQIGQNSLSRAGQPTVTWPAYDRRECDDLEALTNPAVPPDPARSIEEIDVLTQVAALATGAHPVILSTSAKAACIAQGYANIAAELAASAGDPATSTAMSAASASSGARCVW